MSLKRFRPALADCKSALTITPNTPKILLRLAKCHLALAETTAASSALRTLFSVEPKNHQAKLLEGKVKNLESHVKNFLDAKRGGNWGMARLSLDKCLQ